MAAHTEFYQDADVHPIDMVETLAETAEWEFDRVGEDQIAVAIVGQWRTYSLSLIWSRHDDMLRLILTLEFSPPEERMAELHRFLNLANDKVWGGSFTHWEDEKLLSFRSGLVLSGGAEATPEQIEAMVLTAVGLSERFYPAFQIVGWGEESAEKAMKVAIEQAFGTA